MNTTDSHITAGIQIEPEGWRADIIDSRKPIQSAIVASRAWHPTMDEARTAIEKVATERSLTIVWRGMTFGDVYEGSDKLAIVGQTVSSSTTTWSPKKGPMPARFTLAIGHPARKDECWYCRGNKPRRNCTQALQHPSCASGVGSNIVLTTCWPCAETLERRWGKRA